MKHRKPQGRAENSSLDSLEKVIELIQAVHSADVCFEIWGLLTFKNTAVDTALHVRAFREYQHFFMPGVHPFGCLDHGHLSLV